MLDSEKPTTVGELKLSDLPPIEALTISVEEDELIKVGKVASIIDVLVVIEAEKSMPPLDLDSVLFKSNGKPIGHVFDVFGPIKEPHYSVRFNSCEHIKEEKIEKDMPVYIVPEKERKLTKFAFVSEIQKKKGTDASWEHDNEPPEHEIEDSDDDYEYDPNRHNSGKRLSKS